MDTENKKPDLKLVKTPEEMAKEAEKTAELSQKISAFVSKEGIDFARLCKEKIDTFGELETSTKGKSLSIMAASPIAIVMASYISDKVTGHKEADMIIASMDLADIIGMIIQQTVSLAQDFKAAGIHAEK